MQILKALIAAVVGILAACSGALAADQGNGVTLSPEVVQRVQERLA
jgi:hypothetical protein